MLRHASLLAAALALVACASPHASVSNDGDAEVDAGPPALPDPDPDAGPVVWTGWAGEFVHTYCEQCHNPAAPCSGSGCHPGAGPLPDFRLYATVVSYAPRMRCGVAVKQDPAWACDSGDAGIVAQQFPVEQGGNPLPPDDQRDLFVAWIDAGCP